MDAIRETGPGNHYLGSSHTQANFMTAFYRSPLADNNSFEQCTQKVEWIWHSGQMYAGKNCWRSINPLLSIPLPMKRCWSISIDARQNFLIPTCNWEAHKNRTRSTRRLPKILSSISAFLFYLTDSLGGGNPTLQFTTATQQFKWGMGSVLTFQHPPLTGEWGQF